MPEGSGDGAVSSLHFFPVNRLSFAFYSPRIVNAFGRRNRERLWAVIVTGCS